MLRVRIEPGWAQARNGAFANQATPMLNLTFTPYFMYKKFLCYLKFLFKVNRQIFTLCNKFKNFIQVKFSRIHWNLYTWWHKTVQNTAQKKKLGRVAVETWTLAKPIPFFDHKTVVKFLGVYIYKQRSFWTFLALSAHCRPMCFNSVSFILKWSSGGILVARPCNINFYGILMIHRYQIGIYLAGNTWNSIIHIMSFCVSCYTLNISKNKSSKCVSDAYRAIGQ